MYRNEENERIRNGTRDEEVWPRTRDAVDFVRLVNYLGLCDGG